MLIKVKNREVAGIRYLTRLVLTYIYEKDKMRADEINLMQHSIVSWNKKIFLDPDIKFFIQKMGWMLKKDEEGWFDSRKELFKEKGIDWRKFHKLGRIR